MFEDLPKVTQLRWWDIWRTRRWFLGLQVGAPEGGGIGKWKFEIGKEKDRDWKSGAAWAKPHTSQLLSHKLFLEIPHPST